MGRQKYEIGTMEFRKEVGERIKKERKDFFKHCTEEKKREVLDNRKRKRKYEGLSIPEFADLVGIDTDTVYNLENNKSELKTEYLYLISKACKCDIGYLLGECDNRTYIKTDIHKATGLTEEAIEVLVDAKSWVDGKPFADGVTFKDDLLKIFKNDSEVFLNLISTIIESSKVDIVTEYIEEDEDIKESKENYRDRIGERSIFPINQMRDYIVKTRKANEEIHKNPELMKAYPDERIDMIGGKLTTDMEYLIKPSQRRRDRGDIRDSVVEFLKGDYVEKGRVEEG